ncbi:MAG: hypothetical protein M3Y06_05420 [Actinomycetota bacterium]|nr:hypothetical protein [Actinomycetota bacterium]
MTGSSRSPRIADQVVARYRRTEPAALHTLAELNAILGLLRGIKAHSISIGHGRDPASVDAAHALADAWTSAGDLTQPPCVLCIVDWPENAASWLRPAQRLVGSIPDAWVIADTPVGFAQLARRLADQPDWSPARTFAFANLVDPDLVALAGPDLAGLSGATASGDVWHLARWSLIVDPPNATDIPL